MKRVPQRIGSPLDGMPLYAAVLMMLSACVLVVLSIVSLWQADVVDPRMPSGHLDLAQEALPLSRFDLQRRYAQDLEVRLQGLLDASLGPGMSIIRVSVDIAEQTSGARIPDTIGDYVGRLPSLFGGAIRRISLAAVIDSAALAGHTFPRTPRDTSGTRNDYADRIGDLLMAAAGFEEWRSDRLELVVLPLAGSGGDLGTADRTRDIDGVPSETAIWRTVNVILVLLALFTMYRCALILRGSPGPLDPRPAGDTKHGRGTLSTEEGPSEPLLQDPHRRPEDVARVIRHMLAQEDS